MSFRDEAGRQMHDDADLSGGEGLVHQAVGHDAPTRGPTVRRD
jgi:hypothetical protein